ncbi:MAG: pilus assembly protein [Anaerolineae bacterium]|nr:pilus assembly protein [Anaerolineae bacterium]
MLTPKEDALIHKRDRGQSLVEVALVLPLLVVLLAGLVEVVFFARNYLALLEATREGARIGARGAANYDNGEIDTLVRQDLSRQGIDLATGLVDVIIVRADVGPGRVINSYTAVAMHGSGQPVYLSETKLLERLQAGDPQSRFVAVELYYNHQPVLRLPLVSAVFPDPMLTHTYSIMRMLQ